MSGVGVSGLLANLPGTITPYPTQDPALELGGYRSVANAAARDAIPANFRSLGMEVTLQDTGATYTLFGGLTNASWKPVDAPFLGTYFVDPTFTGPTLGSSSNPFTTIAAAFAAAAAQSLTRGIIYLAPGANCIGNVTFPTTGDWEISSLLTYGVFSAIITGNVDMTATASCRRALTGVQVTGNLTGNSSVVSQRILISNGASINGSITLTQTGAGVNRLVCGSPVQSFTGNAVMQVFLTGAVSIAGNFEGSNVVFGTSLSVTATSSFQDCLMPPLTTLAGAGTADMWLFNCSNAVGGPLAFTASGGGQMRLRPDGVTINEFARVSTTLTGNVALFAANGGRSFSATRTSNVGTTAILGILPGGLQVCEACLTLLTNAGATAGNAVLNVTYTDFTGTLVTEPVTTALNVAGAIGSKARGVLPFSQNGASSVSWSVTGITNATSLSYQVDVAVRQAS